MKVLIWGVTGQARVVRPILEAAGHRVRFLADNDRAARSPFADVLDVLSRDKVRELLQREREVGFVVAIGGTHGQARRNIGLELESWGATPLAAVHSCAVLGSTATVGKGAHILMGACVGECARLGDWVIVNTNASIDHDCRIGAGVHVMPGATLAGEVVVEDFATIGSNATVLPRLTIGSGAVVGAGAVVTRNVAPQAIVVGNPAKPRGT